MFKFLQLARLDFFRQVAKESRGIKVQEVSAVLPKRSGISGWSMARTRSAGRRLRSRHRVLGVRTVHITRRGKDSWVSPVMGVGH